MIRFLFILALVAQIRISEAFHVHRVITRITTGCTVYGSSSSEYTEEEYKNLFTAITGKFLPPSIATSSPSFTSKGSESLETIKWNAKKRKGMTRSAMIKTLKSTLPKKQWFVTGLVEPSLFSDNFSFQDPDVKLKGCENYARGVARLFASDCTAEIIDIVGSSDNENKIVITWRLSGSVNLGLLYLICYSIHFKHSYQCVLTRALSNHRSWYSD